jgi:hypothetical protein
MHTKTNIFNKILQNNVEYTNVKDQSNILKTTLLVRPEKYENKIKFGKFQLMENKTHFYKAQRLYHILLRFVQFCKNKRAMVFDIDCDFRMIPFEPTTKIQFIENRKKYPFNIYDLINILSASLLQQTNMFINPQYPKNPYTNLNFERNNLYNFYIKCLTLNIKIPLVVTFFAECEFNIETFLEKHKRMLSELAINTYLSKDVTITETIVEDIYDMCYTNDIKLHSEFPKKEAYAIFRPYLKYHYSKKKVSQLLDCFDLYNPYFGRKYRTPDGKNHFDDRHLPFLKIKNEVFTAWNTNVFNRMKSSKYKYKDVYCISLKPIENATYEEEEEIGEAYAEAYAEEDDDNYSV